MNFPRVWRAACLSATCAISSVAVAGGVATGSLPGHHPQHAAPASRLADTGPMAGAQAGVARLYGGAARDVLTYHYDNSRTGWNSTETDLTPVNVGSGKFGLLATLAVDGNVLAQPLLVSGFQMPDGSKHDVLIVATGRNTVYAYDAQSYALLWKTNLGKPQASDDVGCGDVQPEYGISSTPVIVRNGAGAATLYVVAATEPSAAVFQTMLHAIDLGTGADVQPAVEIAPSAIATDGSALRFDPQNQYNRAGLAAASGAIYVGIGSHCDNNLNAITGWMVRYGTDLSAQGAFHTVDTPSGGLELASIWMAGFAPAVDAHGNLFFVTGNGDFAGKGRDWGESALKLDPALTTVRGHFTPAGFSFLNHWDSDFGSGGIMLLPKVAGQTAPPLAVALGKSGMLYLLDQDRLGGSKPADGGALQATALTQTINGGLWGGTAYFSGGNGPTVFAQIDSDVLRAFSVASTGTPALTQTVSGTSTAGYGGSIPIVSSNGSAAGTGVVWLVRRSSPMELEAYDAEALGAPIFTGHAGQWSNSDQNSFVTPMEANGRVYAPAYKTVKVFGLRP